MKGSLFPNSIIMKISLDFKQLVMIEHQTHLNVLDKT
ncbi:hypothetical protein SLEP1_g52476 [Rubroshorea leprosula]|uniref:Uncharacterized protein n=1 Tax=Rubroshorea leprosula TaxID=152421 RepID=A0AAV5M766_9ROSI|nr:hypothetical protein SLEP1_g52476 [Rubroshorea leprosula]